MVVYKVFYKKYMLRKGELMGALIEKAENLRGMKQFESGLRWAKVTHLRQSRRLEICEPLKAVKNREPPKVAYSNSFS